MRQHPGAPGARRRPWGDCARNHRAYNPGTHRTVKLGRRPPPIHVGKYVDAPPPAQAPAGGPPSEESGFCVVYKHYRTGELMDARDYGYKAWPFKPKKKK